MAVTTVRAYPNWTAIGSGPLIISVRQAPIEIFIGGSPGANDQGVQYSIGDDQRVPAPASTAVYARPLGGSRQAVVIAFAANA